MLSTYSHLRHLLGLHKICDDVLHVRADVLRASCQRKERVRALCTRQRRRLRFQDMKSLSVGVLLVVTSLSEGHHQGARDLVEVQALVARSVAVRCESWCSNAPHEACRGARLLKVPLRHTPSRGQKATKGRAGNHTLAKGDHGRTWWSRRAARTVSMSRPERIHMLAAG